MILASVSQSVKFLLDSHWDESNNSNRKTSSRSKNCVWPMTGRLGVNVTSLNSVLNKATSSFFESLELVPLFVLVFQHHLQKWETNKGI